MKRSTVVLLVLAAGAAGGIAWKVTRPASPTQIVVAKAERVPLLRSIVSATGEVRAKEFVDIQAEVAGVIVELLVREGDTVQQGDVLLRLDDLQLRAAVDAAKAQLAAAVADVANAEAGVAYANANLATQQVALASVKFEREQAAISLERAESSYRRKEELFQQQLIGSEEFEIAAAEARLAKQRLDLQDARKRQAEAQCEAVATQVEAAKTTGQKIASQVDVARANLARAENELSKTVIKAPLAGLITACNVEKGERAVPGIQSNPIATLMTIADMSIIEAEIEVDEADIVQVALGAAATVECDAMRDVELHGTVTEIGQSPIQQTDQQEGKEFKVVVRISEPPASLRPGFTATAEIVTATRSDCLVVPLQALTAREVELDEAGRYKPPPAPVDGDTVIAADTSVARKQTKELEGVFLLVDGRARFRPITTGITGEMDIEVLGGLEGGEEVVIGPFQALRKLAEWDRIEIDPKRQANVTLVRKTTGAR